MGIPTRAQVDAACGSPTTLYQRIAGIVSPLILLGSIAYILLIWRQLPEQIPTHYNAAGQIDGYGGRGTLLIMPVIGLVTDLVVALVGRFPKSWNTGVRVTALNRARVYRLVRDLMADLRITMALLFAGFGIYLATLPEHFSGWIGGVLTVLVLLPLVRYFVRLPRAR
ncbi:MAG: DUF1648 domain-containing protein [Oscillospiraceae bacterium]|nr:DUF1648 domain-containing protein [Oscillospiraceae bacterium]